MRYFSLLVQKKSNQKKHTLPSRLLHDVQKVRFTSGTFRRNVHVAAKSDGHRARRPDGYFPLATPLRKGTQILPPFFYPEYSIG